MNRSAISTATLSSPPGLPLRSITRTLIPWRTSVVHSPVDLVGGSLLKAVELEVADAVGRVDHRRPGHALDVDVAANQAKGLDRPITPPHVELERRSLIPLELVGGFVEAHSLDRPSLRR